MDSILKKKHLFYFCLSIFMASCGGDDSDGGGSVNSMPSVNAGADQSVDEINMVTLSGVASDSDGSIESYTWSQISGVDVVLENTSSPTVTFRAPDLELTETLIFSLEVEDDDGGSSSDTISVQVVANVSPAVNVGNDESVDERTPVELTGIGVDGDGSIVSYLWTQTSGTLVPLTNADSTSVSFTTPDISVEEILVFTLTATDDDGDVGTDSLQLTIIPNIAPTAVAGEDTEVDERETVTLTGLGSDSDGTVESYLWVQQSGTEVTLENTSSSSISFAAPSIDVGEVLVFELSVTDNDGDIATDTVEVTVNPVSFEITLSENINRCGVPVTETVEITFIDSDGGQNLYSIEHDGVEQTYSFDSESTERKTVKVVKLGMDSLIVDVEPSAALFFEMSPPDVESCGCTTYNVDVINEPESFNVSLWVGNDRYNPTSGTDMSWDDIEICSHQADFVYVIDDNQEKFFKVDLSGGENITVNGLNNMAITLLDGNFPVGDGSLPSSWIRGYKESGATSLISEFTLFDSDVSDGVLNYIESESVADVSLELRFSVNYLGAQLDEVPSFRAQNYNSTLFFQERHTIESSLSELSSSASYDLFGFESVDLGMYSDELTISANSELPFDAAHFVFLGNTGSSDDYFEVYLPVNSGLVDYSIIKDALPASRTEGIVAVYLIDYVDIESYDESVASKFRRRLTGQTSQSRSLFYVAF